MSRRKVAETCSDCLRHRFWQLFPPLNSLRPRCRRWAYFTGSAYLAAGAATLFKLLDRLAATLSALMMSLFLLLIWLPKAAAGFDGHN